MGCEPGEGSKLNGRRGPLPHPPSESARREKSLWAEEALSKQRNAAWCPRDGGGEESGGGAAEAARLPASLLANPGKLPPPPAGAVAAPGKREEAALSGCFPVHFCRPGWRERELLFCCPAWLSRTHSRALRLLCPCGWAGDRAGQSVRKRAERWEPTP